MSEKFLSKEPTLDDCWRGIILFGLNAASYKFALARSLIEISAPSGSLVKIADLAPVYARHTCEHLKIADKQGTSPSSTFLNKCRSFNAGEISPDRLTEETVRHGFENVIDAFHTVRSGAVPSPFFIDERRVNRGIRITDEFEQLFSQANSANLPLEVEARWRLVETAWELGVARYLLLVSYDPEGESLFSLDRSSQRKSITGSRNALNGYQKGCCFYCFTEIDIAGNELLPDVDHFFPHTLKQTDLTINLDGVWNLVLACRDCNRGVNGKSSRLPTPRLLERLYRRNEFLIESHHPLRETLIQQTGLTEKDRAAFLNTGHNGARSLLIHLWEPNERAEPRF